MPIAITLLWLTLLGVLVAAGSVASFLRLLLRRLSPVAGRMLFQASPGRKVQADRERVGISISALHGASMALFAVGTTGFLIMWAPDQPAGDLGLSLLIVLGVISIFDQLIPFSLVARHDDPELILKAWLPFLRKAVFLALPLTFPVLISTSIGRLLEPLDQRPEPSNTQDELQELIEAGEQEGLIGQREGAMLHSVVELKDKIVRAVMTPRPEIAALDINSSVDDLRALFRQKRQTRYPVYSGQLDHIEGFVSIQSLMEMPPEEQAKTFLRSLVRPVPFVPETKPVQELLREMQQSTTQLAMVIDEYGSVSGLVTIEDLLEEIVGEIRDEVDLHAHDILKEPAGTYLISGHTGLDHLNEQFQLELDLQDYSTVAGLILAQLGHVPTPGEKIAVNGAKFEVLEADQRTVLKVRMTIAAASPADNPSHAQPSNS